MQDVKQRPELKMITIQDLFKFLFQHEKTIVLSNLGRSPNLVFDVLEAEYANVDVVVVSPYYTFPSRGRIRTAPVENLSNIQCDLLIYAEPVPHVKVQKPPDVGRLAVLTSHLAFTHDPGMLLVSYFHFGPGVTPDSIMSKTQELQSRRDPSVQTHNAHHVRVDHTRVRVVDGANPTVSFESKNPHYIVLDLTRLSSKIRMYLAFWDAFDRMLDWPVDRWLVCFPEKSGYRAFEQFVQDVLDRLYCLRFEHGNIFDLKQILLLLPFYRSGIVGQQFSIQKEEFGGIEYVAPSSALELYRAGTQSDLRHWAGSIYRVIDDDE